MARCRDAGAITVTGRDRDARALAMVTQWRWSVLYAPPVRRRDAGCCRRRSGRRGNYRIADKYRLLVQGGPVGWGHYCNSLIWGCLMKKFGLSVLPALVAALFSMFATAEAVNATVFNLSANGASGAYSGEVTIDTVTGTVVSGDINVAGFSPDFTSLFLAFQDSDAAELFFAQSTTFPTNMFQFSLLNGGSFVGYDGGAISSVFVTEDCNSSGGCNAFDGYFVDGSLTVAPAVPEPSTWAMMILGFAGVGFMACRRSRKDQGLALAAA
jgi:PEP-CTERM motif